VNFEHHAFISYAHIDDTPLSPEQQGWVTRFHATFEALLSMRIGQRARIWRDARLHGNDVFGAELVDRIGRSAMLITVLTPRYLESDWCARELKEFCAQAGHGAALAEQNKSRVFKVVKTPVKHQSLPESIRETLGYSFYVLENGTPLELDAAYGGTFAEHYNRMVCKLSWDAAQLLQQIEAKGESNCAAPARPDKVSTVYLAQCSHDQQAARERLEADLTRQGYTVLPDQRLPLESEAECIRVISGWLERCCLSVHLIGSQPGAVPDGLRGESIVVLQNELARGRSHSHGLTRLIWLPAGTQSALPTHQSFIDTLQRDAELQWGADLLTGSPEALLQAMHETLARLERLASAPAASSIVPTAAPAPSPLLYFICVEPDRKASIPLRRTLRECGFEVTLPCFEGDAAALRESHQRLLSECDLALIYYGAGNDAWKRSVDSDLKKSTFQRGSALRRYTYLAQPRSADKEDLLEMQEDSVIDGLGSIPTERIAALFDAACAARAS
jgi:hypothetical protein